MINQDEIVRLDEAGRPKYLYESRHNHAARRLRGKDGKFIASTIFIYSARPDN